VAVGALAAKGVVRDLAVEAWTREAARHGLCGNVVPLVRRYGRLSRCILEGAVGHLCW
jgi:hypothetical protein